MTKYSPNRWALTLLVRLTTKPSHARRIILDDAQAFGVDHRSFSRARPTWNVIVLLRIAEIARLHNAPARRVLAALYTWRSRRHNLTLPMGVFAPGLCIVHLGGLVVNAQAKVGRNCRLHQFATIGSRRGISPVIGSNVWIGPGAVISGGVVVGDGAVIAANAVVLEDVAPHVTVGGSPAKFVSDSGSSPLLPTGVRSQAKNVTVIVPAFQRQSLLEEALDSLRTQTVPPHEILVVDDFSQPALMLPKWCDSTYHMVRRTQNGGQAASINSGVDQSTGDLLMFLDDDDLFPPDRLRRSVDEIGNSDIHVCRSQGFSGDSLGKPSGRELFGSVSDRILESQTPSLGATTVRREAWTPLDTSYTASADVEWWIRAAENAVVSSSQWVGHRVRHHEGVRVLNSGGKRVESSLRLLNEHATYFGKRPAAAGFRWKRIGVRAERSGDLPFALRAYVNSLRAHFNLGALARLMRTAARSARAVILSTKLKDRA